MTKQSSHNMITEETYRNLFPGLYSLASKVRLYVTYAKVPVNKQRAVLFDCAQDFPQDTQTNYNSLTRYCRDRVSSCNIYAVQQDT